MDGLLTPERLKLICISFAAAWLCVLAVDVWVHTRHGVVDYKGEQLGRDFVNSWAAPMLAAKGDPAAVYSASQLTAFERTLTAPNALPKFYSYPPTYLLLTSPLSVLPLIPAYLVWILLGWAVLAALMRPFLGGRTAWIAILASPSVFMNNTAGQNGAMTTAALVGGLMLLDRRPILAGMVLGLLSVKPQLALLAPLALMAGGFWRALFAMGATSVALAGASVLMFGLAPWEAFIANFPVQRQLLDLEPSIWQRLPTVYSTWRLLGASADLAYLAQFVAAGFAALCVFLVWRRPGPTLIKGAVLILAGLASTPYAWDYDSIALVFAAVWLWNARSPSPTQSWEKLLLSVLVALPAIAPLLANQLHLQIAPFCLFPLIAYRAWMSEARPSSIPISGSSQFK